VTESIITTITIVNDKMFVPRQKCNGQSFGRQRSRRGLKNRTVCPFFVFK